MLSKKKYDLYIPGVKSLAKLGVRPNHLTLLGFGLAIIALFQEYWTGITLFFISFVIDVVDGNLARHGNMKTAFGGFLDSVCDKIVEILFIYYLTVKLSVQTIGLLSVGLSIMISYIKHRSGLQLHSIFDRAERLIYLLIIILFFTNNLSQIIAAFNIYNTLCIIAIIQLIVKVRRRL